MTDPRWLSASARLTEFYLCAVARTVSTRLLIENVPVDTAPESKSGSGAHLSRLIQSSSLLLPFWNAHSLMLVTAYLSSSILREAGRWVQAVADDSPGGRITSLLFARIGLIGRSLSIASPEQRLEDLRAILTLRPSLVMAADSHGPYRAISAGMARIVRCYAGNVRPISVACTRSVPIFRRIRMRVPLPRARIVVAVGRLFGEAAPDEPLLEIRKRLASMLRDLEANLSLK